MSTSGRILAEAAARSATCGGSRVIALDGPSGGGKSTVAAALAREGAAQLVHTDDLCPGWDGLPLLPRILVDLLGPIADGRAGRSPRYDWILGRHVEDLVVDPTPLIVLDGVGSGARLLAPFTTVLVWLDADPELRRTRAVARDGDSFREHWAPWATCETAYFAAEDLPARADLGFRTE